MSTEENTGYISNSSERSTSCQRKKTLVTYRIQQRGPLMSTEENTGYISNSSERSTPCQRKKTLVTYRIHQRGPHHVNGRKHWLHIEFIIEVHIMSTKENTGYISNSSEMSTTCQRKKTLVTYRIHPRGPRLFSSVDMLWTSLMNSICNQCFLSLTWRGPLGWIRYVTSVFFRWHDVDLSDEFDM